jgi:hypothetical protein
MTAGGQTPEELETLLEDAFVVRDPAGLARLFEKGGVLVPGHGLPAARGRDEIAHVAGQLWENVYAAQLWETVYLAAPRHVVQARDTALVVGADGVNVARRGRDRYWRYAIAFLR